MKKKFILLFLFISSFLSCDYAFSIDTNINDYQIIENQSYEEIQDIKEEKIDSVFETDKIKILKVNNKYGIYDKENSSIIFEPIIDEISAFNQNEYKIKIGKSVGYINLDNKSNFMTD